MRSAQAQRFATSGSLGCLGLKIRQQRLQHGQSSVSGAFTAHLVGLKLADAELQPQQGFQHAGIEFTTSSAEI